MRAGWHIGMSLAPTFLCQLSQRPLPDSGREGCFVKNLRPWGYHVPSLWEKKLGLLVLRPALGWAWEPCVSRNGPLGTRG